MSSPYAYPQGAITSNMLCADDEGQGGNVSEESIIEKISFV